MAEHLAKMHDDNERLRKQNEATREAINKAAELVRECYKTNNLRWEPEECENRLRKAVNLLHAALAMPILDRLVDKPGILDTLRERLESDDIVE